MHEEWRKQELEAMRRLRAWMERELARARADFERALVEGKNELVWQGRQFFVDRVRRLIVSETEAKSSAGQETLIDDGELGDVRCTIDVYGGEDQLMSATDLTQVWARLARGLEMGVLGGMDEQKLLNLAVAQVSINPAFASILVLAFAEDLQLIDDGTGNFFEQLGPMIYRLSELPTRMPAPAEVRRAQVDFVAKLAPDRVDASCESLDEEEWARRCAEVLAQLEDYVWWRFYAHIRSRAQSLHEPGMRAMP